MRAVSTIVALFLAGCGQPPADPESAPAMERAAAAEAAAAEAASADDAVLAGLPPDAVALPNDQGRKLWAVRRPEGRALVYELMADGQMSGTGGRIEDLPAIYPGVDLGPLQAE